MAWDDWVLGIATCGLYNLGKAAYNALNSAGDAADDAGSAIAVLGSTLETVGNQLVSFLAETEELITIKRLTPRSESDLWEEEKERLAGLKQRRTELESELAALGVSEPSDFSFDITSILTDLENSVKRMQLIAKLVAVNKEISEIMYHEPGIVSTAIYNASETLERFNTIEQPKLEGIMDELEDNLQASEETLTEVNKLFVTKRLVPVLDAELTGDMRSRLSALEGQRKHFSALYDRHGALSDKLNLAMTKIPASNFDISETRIKVAGLATNETIFSQGKTMAAIQPSGLAAPSAAGAMTAGRAAVEIARPAAAALGPPVAGTPQKLMAKGPSFQLANRPKNVLGKSVPQGARISAMLNTRFDGYQRAYESFQARRAHYGREMGRIDRLIGKIKFKTVEEPGVVPQILDEVHTILGRVNTQEQPKIDAVLDTLNDDLKEVKTLIGNANRSIGSAGGIMSFFTKHATAIKVGLGVFGAIVFLNLFFGLIVLIKMTFGL